MSTRRAQELRSGTVYIVDDEELVRLAVARVVESSGWTPLMCKSGTELLETVGDTHPACVVLELCMRDASGTEVQHVLLAREIYLPVIFLTGAGTVSVVADTFRDGAFDFLEKPVKTVILSKRIGEALREDSRRVLFAEVRKRFESLTTREMEVCGMLARGWASKRIAQELSISTRTVEHHRARILQKTGSANTAEMSSLHGLARASAPR